jgi:REP element-mobilizing transposase RayT
MEKYKSNRLNNYNYSNNGYYFITIITKNRINYFGKIKKGKIVLNKFGEIVNRCWKEIPKHFNNIILDEFIIMPNHVHGILIINHQISPDVADADLRPLHQGKFDRSKMYLSKTIHGFKSSVTRTINNNFKNSGFGWQWSFHDRIIRNERELNIKQRYIENNPINWEIKNK